jgi:hypothetical protein
MKTSRRRNRRRIHADTAAFDANQKASIANYIASFQQEYLVCADATICSRAEHFTVDGSLIEPRGRAQELQAQGDARPRNRRRLSR